MVVRLKITLEQEEYSALLRISRSEMRNPEAQLRYILHEELIRRGLFTPDEKPEIQSSKTAINPRAKARS